MQHIFPKVNKFLFPFLSDPGKPGLYNIFYLFATFIKTYILTFFQTRFISVKSLSLRFLEPSITFMNSTPVVKTEGGGNFCLFILLKKSIFFFSGGALVEIGFCQYWTILD